MAYDHSQTYRKLKLRNLPHILRIRRIMSVLDKMSDGYTINTYADFGCSTAYLSNEVATRINAQALYGFDHSSEHVALAAQTYPHGTFREVDLNVSNTSGETFDFVTCFEVFEHVGDLQQGIPHVLDAIKPGGGLGLIVVPIESRFRGWLKFQLKTKIYGYKLNELNDDAAFAKLYAKTLRSGGLMSQFRNPPRSHWGTHFGFETRDVDALLVQREDITAKAYDAGFNRFYELTRG